MTVTLQNTDYQKKYMRQISICIVSTKMYFSMIQKHLLKEKYLL